MASFLTDLAKPYVERSINAAIAESSYICCFTCIAKDYEEEKDRLEIERTTFERRIEEATRRGEDVLPDALAWKDEVDQLIQEDTKKNQKCFFEFCPDCLWKYSRGKLLANKKERIKELITTGKELTIGFPAHLPDIERCTNQHYVHLKSRESQYTKLLVELKDDNNYMIGLHGMGGTGKTTLIKKVGKELKESKQFTQVIDTTVSFTPNIKKIQDDIAGPLGLKFDDCNDVDRPKKLWHRLTNGEKILLILDDVWGYVDFNEIGIPYSDNCKGCRIIVTTRDRSVCNKLGCNKTIQLDLLSKEDAWIMFKKYADLSETSTEFFLDKGRKIANECKNLPFAVVVIASSLKGRQHQQHRDEWDMALKFLKKDISRHKDDDDVLEIYKCLKFSYDKLDEEAKSLFLLCSVFREDEEIDTERLARLAIGGGLFGEDYGSYEEARSRVVRSKNKLLDSCLLMEANQWSMKMHDFARDAAQWIANKEIQTRKVYDKNQKETIEKEKNIKYLLCEGEPEEIFSCKFDGSMVEILIVIIDTTCDFCDRVIVPDSFFENNVSFRVFHLRSDTLFRDISLPQSMQQLKNIRSLIFTSCKLGDIYIFGNLQSLEELDLVHCQINEMPNGITELEKFRLLKMERCSIDRNNPFEVIKRCSSLQELYFVNCQSIFLGEISFPKLQRFHVSDSEIDSSLSKYVSIEWRKELFLSETTLKYCMQEAEVLRLTRIEGEWKNIIPDIVHMDHGMNNLVELDLSFISQLKFLIYTEDPHSQVSNVFSKLVRVHLNCMGNLEELCNSSLSVDSFKSLESLSIQNCKQLRSLSGIANQCNLKSVSLTRCPMLISLFEVSTSHNLVLLEKLEVIDCENLEYLIKDERKGEICDSNSSNPMFMKLKVLEILGCPKLKKIIPLISAHDLPALKSIKVESCEKLNYIFGQYVELGSLEDMKLGRVPNLIDIFQECNRTMSCSINRSSPISISASKPTPHSNPIKCSILSWTDMYCCGKKLRSTTSSKIPLIDENQPQTNLMESNSNCLSINIWERAQCLSRQSKILCNVKKIELTDLRKIKSVFVLSIAPRMLLEELIITRCHELEQIIIDTGDHDSTGGNNYGNVFPKLKELVIDDCMQLEYIFGHYTSDHQNHTERIFCVNEVNEQQVNSGLKNLTKIRIIGCEKLQIIFSDSILRCLPQLDELIIRDCEELKHIFQDDLENQNMSSSTTCFPKLKALWVEKCNKLKYVFPVSICNQLPELKVLIITEAKELEEIFKSSQGDGIEIVRIPNLYFVATLGLPSLFQTQEIQFQRAVFIKNCDKLSLTSTSTELNLQLFWSILDNIPDFKGSWYLYLRLQELFRLLSHYKVRESISAEIEVEAASADKSTSPQIKVKQTQETDQELVENVVGLGTPSVAILPTNSETSMNEQSVDLTSPLEENDATVTRSQGLNYTSKLGHPFDFKQGIEISVEQGTTSSNSKAMTLSGPITSEQTPMNEQTMDQRSPLIETDATATVTPSQLEGSMSEKAVGTKNVSPIQLVAPKQKGIKISVEESELINEQSMTQHQSFGESQATIKPSQGNNGSTLEKLAAATLCTISETKNAIQLVSPKQKDIKTSVEGRIASSNAKTLTSSTFKREEPSHDIVISVEQETTSTNSKAITSSGPIVISEQAPMIEQLEDKKCPLEETDATATSSLELINEHSTIQQQSLGEPSQVNNGSTSEKIAAATLSTISETKNESPKQKDTKISVEGGTALTNAKTLASSTSKPEKSSHVMEISVEQGTTSTKSRGITSSGPVVTSEHNSSSQEYGNDQTTIQSFSISKKESLAMEVVDLEGSQETNQIKNLGDTSQVVEGLGSLLVQKELEQLVSENHLNYETLSLLTDFFVKHPSILLKDAFLTNRFKGYAYTCLADLLIFLQTHSVLDVLGSSHSEFVNLLQVMRNFPFNKDWLDGVEKRALFPDLQFSRDAMQKLLDSKKQVTKEVEEMRLKLYFVNQHAEDIKHQLRSSEAVLASIIKQEEQVLETTAALSVPLGY